MKLTDFDYTFPQELVAQYPAQVRDHSRMMLLDRERQGLSHHHFYDFPNYFNSCDILVLNETKVLPARLLASLENGKKIELLLIRPLAKNSLGAELWETLIKPAKFVQQETKIFFGNEKETFAVLKQAYGKYKQIEFAASVNVRDLMLNEGLAPLPPYIRKGSATFKDRDLYQSVFAKNEGSIAAPTASLHFTDEVLAQLKNKGVQIVKITLHVGLGTFESIQCQQIEEHQMKEEFYELSLEARLILQNAKKEGKRITAVGTTVMRALESYAQAGYFDRGGDVPSGLLKTDLFITPAYSFKIVDRFLTNFHMPCSSPYILTSSFAGLNFLKKAYQEAIQERYRLFSYGDCMFIC